MIVIIFFNTLRATKSWNKRPWDSKNVGVNRKFEVTLWRGLIRKGSIARRERKYRWIIRKILRGIFHVLAVITRTGGLNILNI